jgi:hypothetical protein
MAGFPQGGGVMTMAGDVTGLSNASVVGTVEGGLLPAVLNPAGAQNWNSAQLNTFLGNLAVNGNFTANGIISLNGGPFRLINHGFPTTTSNINITQPTQLASAAAGAIVLTLQATQTQGSIVFVKKIDASANTVTITPATGTIDGAANYVLAAQNNAAIFTFDGANWWVLAAK